jgi:hypothetical protein
VLVGLTAKLLVDARRGAPMLWDGEADVVVASAAHLAGGLVALVMFAIVAVRAQRPPAAR